MTSTFEKSIQYEHHLIRLKNETALVDCKPPNFILTEFFSPPNCLKDKIRSDVILKQNIQLLGKINEICRITAKKCDANDPTILIGSSRIKMQKNLNKLIEKENCRMDANLSKIPENVQSAKDAEKDWQITLQRIRKNCRQKVVIPELMIKKKFIEQKNRPMVYLDVGEKNCRPIGRLIITLYLDYAPITSKNFIDLCENHRDWPSPCARPEKSDSDCTCTIYEEPSSECDYIDKKHKLIGTKFHRIFPNLFIYGGKLKGETIPDYKPEKCQLSHHHKGTLSMCPMSNGLVNSEFTISLKPLDVLNDKRLAFGRVVKGLNILDIISNSGTYTGKPRKCFEILDCGIIHLNLE